MNFYQFYFIFFNLNFPLFTGISSRHFQIEQDIDGRKCYICKECNYNTNSLTQTEVNKALYDHLFSKHPKRYADFRAGYKKMKCIFCRNMLPLHRHPIVLLTSELQLLWVSDLTDSICRGNIWG